MQKNKFAWKFSSGWKIILYQKPPYFVYIMHKEILNTQRNFIMNSQDTKSNNHSKDFPLNKTYIFK